MEDIQNTWCHGFRQRLSVHQAVAVIVWWKLPICWNHKVRKRGVQLASRETRRTSCHSSVSYGLLLLFPHCCPVETENIKSFLHKYFKVFFEHTAQSEYRMGITVCQIILVLLLRNLNWFWFGVVIHIKSGVANVNVIFNSHTCIYYALCVAGMKHQFGAWNLLKRPTSVLRYMNVILLHCHHH
jgi:hypothetical protein